MRERLLMTLTWLLTRSLAVAAVLAGLWAFTHSYVDTPFPEVHVLAYLDPVMVPLLNFGSGVYALGTGSLLLPTTIVTAILWLGWCGWLWRRDRDGYGIAVVTSVALPLLGMLVFWFQDDKAPRFPVVAYGLAIAGFLVAFVGAIRWRERPLFHPLPEPPPWFRHGALLLLLVLATLTRTYYLDAHPPGQAGHTMERGRDSIMLMKEYPVSLTDFQWEQWQAAARRTGQFMPGWYGLSILGDWVGFLLFGPSLLVQRGMTVIFGVLGVGLVILLGEELFGTWPGLAAGLLVAASPWNITHSRYSSVEHAICFFVMVLAVYLLVLGYRRGSVFAWAGCLLTLGVCFYAYTAAQFLIAILALFVVYVSVRHWRRPLTVLVPGVLAFAGALLISQPKTQIFTVGNPRALINAPIGHHSSYLVQGWETILLNVLDLFRSIFFEGRGGAWFWKNPGGFLLLPVAALLVAGLGWCLPRVWDSRCVLLSLTFFLGVLPTVPSDRIVPRRILAAHPTMYILAGFMLVLLVARVPWQLPQRWRKAGSIFFVGFLSIVTLSGGLSTFINQVEVWEVSRNGNGPVRRLGEIVTTYLPDRHVYLFYRTFRNEHVVQIFAAKHYDVWPDEPPYRFFGRNEILELLFPRFTVGREGAVFIFPADPNADEIRQHIQRMLPGGELTQHRIDHNYLDHGSGEPYAWSYEVPGKILHEMRGVLVSSAPQEGVDPATPQPPPRTVRALGDIKWLINDHNLREPIRLETSYLRLHPDYMRIEVAGAVPVVTRMNGRRLRFQRSRDGVYFTNDVLWDRGFHHLELELTDIDADFSIRLRPKRRAPINLDPAHTFARLTPGLRRYLRVLPQIDGDYNYVGTWDLPAIEGRGDWVIKAHPHGDWLFLEKGSGQIWRYDRETATYSDFARIREPEGIQDFAICKSDRYAAIMGADPRVVIFNGTFRPVQGPATPGFGRVAILGNEQLAITSSREQRGQHIFPSGNFRHLIGQGSQVEGEFSLPLDVEAVNPQQFAVLDGSQELYLYDNEARFQRSVVLPFQPTPSMPPSMAIDEAGNVFITDYHNDLVSWCNLQGEQYPGREDLTVEGIPASNPVEVFARDGHLLVVHDDGRVHHYRYWTGARPEEE